MRIISGNLKGKKLNFLNAPSTRPLKDMVRESIFNTILHSNLINVTIPNSLVLDIYSGTGSFGIECISRGASVVNFVEKDKVKAGIKAPLDLVICKNCSLIQLRHTAPQELLYSRNYWYRSGVTQTMRDGLRDVSSTIEQIVDLKKDDVVLDIGANDGGFALQTLEYGFRGKIISFEPTSEVYENLKKNSHCSKSFFL